MRVRWLRVALANLDAEAEYIAEDNPAAVQKIFRAGSNEEGASHGKGGASCGDAGAGRCRNTVHHSLSSSGRCRGNLAGVSCRAGVAGEVLIVDKRVRKECHLPSKWRW